MGVADEMVLFHSMMSVVFLTVALVIWTVDIT